MNGHRSMRLPHAYGVGLSLVLTSAQASAQSEPATIPTVVAQATFLAPGMFGTPHYFDGQTPTDWPVALVPPGAKVVGGGVVGDSSLFRLRVAVFAFSDRSKPSEVLRAMLARAGYVPHDILSPRGSGGFVATELSTLPARYCKGSTLATFAAVDSLKSPLVMGVHLLDGEGGRQNCGPQRDQFTPNRLPVTVPTLSPPSGALSFGGGSSWGGSGGQVQSTLRTTMPADSVLAHYTAQLVGGGWKSEGRPAVTDAVGVQRFSFREGQQAWTAALIIMAAGDRREVLLQFTMAQ